VDEREHAQVVARHLGTEHHEVEVKPLDATLLPRVAWYFGEPLADPAALATFQLSELTRSRVTVALNGDGGDEAFAGYRRYRHLARTAPAERVPAGARAAAARALLRLARGDEGRSPLPRAARLARRLALAPPERYADLMRYFSPADRRAVYGPLLEPVLEPDLSLAHLGAAWVAGEGLDWTDRAMLMDIDTYLADDLVAKVDITSMAHGLEVRSPLLDQELLEFAATLPAELKLHGADDKRVLRKAAEPWLPAQILAREKHGLELPVARWVRGPLRGLVRDLLLDARTLERGVFRRDGVEAMLAQHDGGLDRGHQLWAMMTLELWFRACVDDPLAGPPA
jgi:asparagine synthase (glutamine-hydrolysing)